MTTLKRTVCSLFSMNPQKCKEFTGNPDAKSVTAYVPLKSLIIVYLNHNLRNKKVTCHFCSKVLQCPPWRLFKNSQLIVIHNTTKRIVKSILYSNSWVYGFPDLAKNHVKFAMLPVEKNVLTVTVTSSEISTFA